MLWRISDLIGYSVQATDGGIGAVSDFLIDDRAWDVRWAVIDTGAWLPGRKVLLPPTAFGDGDPERRAFPVDLTREGVENSPPLDADRPVSRQVEADLYGHYGWAPYWGGAHGMPAYYTPAAGAAGAVPPVATPVPLQGEADPAAPRPPGTAAAENRDGDPHLRSANEVTGYYVQATDGDVGHIEDLVVEAGSWKTRYLLVDTRNWWPGRLVLIAPDWASDVSWAERKVLVDVSREKVKGSPEYDATKPIDRGYEARLHSYYDARPYWGGM